MSLPNTLNSLPVDAGMELQMAIGRGGLIPPSDLGWGGGSRDTLSICTRLMIEHGECAYYLCTTTIGGKPRRIACPRSEEGIGSRTAFCIQILIQGVLTKVCLPIWRSIW